MDPEEAAPAAPAAPEPAASLDLEVPLEVPRLPEPTFPTAEYIGGPAGTGKTYLVRERATKFRGVQLCATTGIAAVNLGEGVTTINSLLGFFDLDSLRDAWSQGFLARKLRKHYAAGLRHIVLDEVSMLSDEALTILTAAVQEFNAAMEEHGQRGIGLTLTGDFCQLPPIKAKFAFEADCWEGYDQNKTLLSKFYRQTDPQFLAALQDARKGRGGQACEYFEPFFHLAQDPDYPNTTILSKNDEVERFNLLRLSKVPGAVVAWNAQRWGKERGEWKLIPNLLSMKVGALVMILANEREYDDDGQPGDLIYANGDLGELLDDNGLVRLRRNGEEVRVLPVTRQNLEVPEPGRRKELRAAGKELYLVCANLGCKRCRGDGMLLPNGEQCDDAKYEVVGGITYVPLRLAYAVTVHKSQGLTMDQCQVDFRDRFFDSPGMLYVALSRVRTPAGLRLVGRPEQFVRRCKSDPKVGRWL